MAPLDFGRSVNPISTRGGADFVNQILLAPPDLQTFLRPWSTKRSTKKPQDNTHVFVENKFFFSINVTETDKSLLFEVLFSYTQSLTDGQKKEQ